MLGKLIEKSEAGKCLVIGTIMADRLIIMQQKLSVLRTLSVLGNIINQIIIEVGISAGFFFAT